MKKIIVIGGAGFIGTNLVISAIKRGCDVVIFDNVHSTLIHYCLENNIPYFIVIDEGMMVNFSKKMTKWMLELKKSKRLFFNHEKDSLYMALINLPKIHKDLDDYYKKLI